MSSIRVYLILCGIVVVTSCKQQSNKKDYTTDDWNKGTAHIVADTNLRFILDQLVIVYEHYYPDSKILIEYGHEEEIIRNFKANKLKTILVSTALSKDELAYCSEIQGGKTSQQLFGFDAVAVICSKSNADSSFDLSNVNKLLKEQDKALIFDHAQSGIARLIMEKGKVQPSLLKNAKVINNVNDVVKYVAAQNNRIGFIPFSLISNPNEQSAKRILEQIKILPVKVNDSLFNLSQSGLVYEGYPLFRPISFIIGNTNEINSLGFSSFLMKQQVSKVIILNGLIPAIMPERKYNYTEEFNPEGKQK